MMRHLLVPAMLLAGSLVLTLAPPAAAHICFTTVLGPDPASCDAHDCRPDGTEAHLGHVVLHLGHFGGYHACGAILHVGADGNLEHGYVCVDAPGRPFCVEWILPIPIEILS